METQLARRTVEQYLPVIRAIYASLEVSVTAASQLENKDDLYFSYLEKEFGMSSLLHAGYLLELWFKDSPDFEIKHVTFHKKNKKAKWADLFKLLDAKIIEYQNGTPIFGVGIHRNGRIVREFMGQKLVHDFGTDGLKKEIIFYLVERGDFTRTGEIQKIIGSKSVESVTKIILSINTILRTKFQLPQDHKFIDSKRGSGYRINPIYNVIRLD